jgi:protein TonB
VSRRADIVTAALAVAVHIVAAFAIPYTRPEASPPRPRRIDVEFRRPVPAPAPAPVPAPAAARAMPAPPTPPPAARASRPAARKLAVAAPSPRPLQPAPPESPPPAAPAPHVYGIAMESPTDATSAIAVPLGGSTAAGSAQRGKGVARGAPNADVGLGGEGADLAIKTMPEIDTDACGRTISYPALAERAGVEGKVRLRVALDSTGRVLSARVLRGLGHGLDEAAVEALTHRCRFTPAIASNGRPVPFVIESYTFAFELPR